MCALVSMIHRAVMKLSKRSTKKSTSTAKSRIANACKK
jgi:hypothetical protein